MSPQIAKPITQVGRYVKYVTFYYTDVRCWSFPSHHLRSRLMGTPPFKSRVKLRELKWPLLSPTSFLDYSNPRPQESLHWHPTGTHGLDNSWICFIWTKGPNKSVWMGLTDSWDSPKVWTISWESMCFSTDSWEIVNCWLRLVNCV